MILLPFVNRMKNLIAVIVLIMAGTMNGVPLEDLFPFGEDKGDELLPSMTDGSSGPIGLRVPFPFFDRLENTLYVDVHGTLLFENSQAHHTPDCAPVESANRMIAAFWADIVTHEGVGGSVSFRQDVSPNLLRKASRLIVGKFPKMEGLRLRWLFIATWLNVTFYGAEGCQSNPNNYPRNTFQVVLATDGTLSFAIFNYNSIVWTTSRFRTSAGNCSGLGGFPARVGFDPGDMKNFYSLNESCTNDIVNVDERTNADQPGKWIFRIDDSHTIQMTSPFLAGSSICNLTTFDRKLRVRPSFIDVFGGPITILGLPCISAKQHKAVCIFNDPKKGKLLTSGQIIAMPENGAIPQVNCIAPFMHDTGRIKVELEIIDRGDDQKIERFHGWLAVTKKLPEVKVTLLRNSHGMDVEWDPEAPAVLNATMVDIEILEFYGGDNATWRDGGLLASNVPNNGRYEQRSLYPAFLPDGNGLAILAIAKSSANSQQRKLVRDRRQIGADYAMVEEDEIEFQPDEVGELPEAERIDPTFNQVYRESQISDYISKVGTKSKYEKRSACLRWYGQDEGVSSDSLIPCPPTLARARFDDAFEQDPCAYHINKQTCLDKYHPNAIDSYLASNPDDEGHGQQCTYAKNGALLIGPPNGGTADMASPWSFFGQTEHMEKDIVPWIACCSDGDADLCRLYYEKRPSDDGSRYRNPARSSAIGDPHITTFDGLEYTFNGVGEFWMVKPADGDENNSTFFKMQARMEKIYLPPISHDNVSSSPNNNVNASVFTAFVMRDGHGPVVQIQLSQSDDVRLVDILVDGDQLSYDSPLLLSQQFDGVSIRARYQNLSDVTVSFTSGVSFRFLSSHDAMSVFSTAGSSSTRNHQNPFSGLLGNVDGDPLNDLSLPNGSVLDPNNSSASKIHYQFGLKWMVKENETMFSYIEGESYATFSQPDFVPLLDLPEKKEVPPEVLAVCGSSEHCVFDYLATGGNLAIAKSTADVKSIENEVRSVVENTPQMLCPSIDSPANGRMTTANESNLVDNATAHFECENGYQLVGPAVVTCQNGTWKPQLPRCLSAKQIEEEAKICQLPSWPQSGTLEIMSESSVNFTCNPGFQLVGVAVISCENGTWSADPPKCLPNFNNNSNNNNNNSNNETSPQMTKQQDNNNFYLSSYLPIFLIVATIIFIALVITVGVIYLKRLNKKQPSSASSPLSSTPPRSSSDPYHNRILLVPNDVDGTTTTTIRKTSSSSDGTTSSSDQKSRQPLLF